MQTVYQAIQPAQPGTRILTDDKAPVEVLGMAVLDELIEKELSFVRNAFRLATSPLSLVDRPLGLIDPPRESQRQLALFEV